MLSEKSVNIFFNPQTTVRAPLLGDALRGATNGPARCSLPALLLGFAGDTELRPTSSEGATNAVPNDPSAGLAGPVAAAAAIRTPNRSETRWSHAITVILATPVRWPANLRNSEISRVKQLLKRTETKVLNLSTGSRRASSARHWLCREESACAARGDGVLLRWIRSWVRGGLWGLWGLRCVNRSRVRRSPFPPAQHPDPLAVRRCNVRGRATSTTRARFHL